MEFLTIPVLLLVIFAPVPSDKAKLADFGRFSNAIGQQISLVDDDGFVHEGVLRAASSSEVTMEFGSSTKTFKRDVIASGERKRDGRIDGLIKGMLIGLLHAGAVVAEPETRGSRGTIWLTTLTFWASIGYVVDATQNHPQPIYRAPAPPKPAVKMSLRF